MQPKIKKITTLLFAVLFYASALSARNEQDKYDRYSRVIGRLDAYSPINYYKLVPSDKKGFVFAYEADLCLSDSAGPVFKRDHSIMLKEYNKQNDNEWQLYSSIRNGSFIRASVIDTLYLDSLAVKNGDGWDIPYQLDFECSYIKYVKFPGQHQAKNSWYQGQESWPEIHFKAPVKFKLCTFSGLYFRNVVFDNTTVFLNNFTFGRFSDGVVFDNVMFKGKVRIINDFISQITKTPSDHPLAAMVRREIGRAKKIFTMSLNDLFSEIQVQQAYKITSACIFYDEAAVFNTNPFYSFDFSGATFKRKTYITDLFPDYLRLRYDDRQICDRPEIMMAPPSSGKFPICNMSFNSASFSGYTSFNNQYVNSIDLRDAFFSDTLMLFNAVFRDSLKNNHGFYYAHLLPGLDVVLNPSAFNLSSLNINPVSIDGVDFIYCHMNPAIPVYSKALLDNLNSFYNKLIADIRLTYSQDHDLATSLINKYRHQQLVSRSLYLWGNLGVKNIFELLKLGFLEFTVGNGYKGGANFIVSSLLMILFFTLQYYLFFGEYFVGFINEENGEKRQAVGRKRKRSSYDPKEYSKNFLKCFWKSFYIFFNPRFSYSYFAFPRPLFIIAVLEWLIGLVMIALFLIYVAATYPFIRSLIGIG